jgi:hypothetical protein
VISHAVKQEAGIIVLAPGMIPVLECLDDLGPCHLAGALHDGVLVVLQVFAGVTEIGVDVNGEALGNVTQDQLLGLQILDEGQDIEPGGEVAGAFNFSAPAKIS